MVCRYREQLVDHFDALNTQTWAQRYFVNDSFFNGHGPVFLCVGGETVLEPDVVVTGSYHCGWMVVLAERHKALIVAVEHRYYGLSHPVPDLTTPNMRYLSSRQGLEDLAQIRSYIAGKYHLTNDNLWVSWGGSYPGMMSSWFRLKYPHLVHAAIADSAPVQAQLDFPGFYQVVAESMAAEIVRGSKECADAIESGFAVSNAYGASKP